MGITRGKRTTQVATSPVHGTFWAKTSEAEPTNTFSELLKPRELSLAVDDEDRDALGKLQGPQRVVPEKGDTRPRRV
jgi:hypothetical protein